MKRLSDFNGDEAIELWGELFEPFSALFTDKKIQEQIASGVSFNLLAGALCKKHPKEVKAILTKIDDTPITGANLVTRMMNLLSDVFTNQSESFFGSSEQEKGEKESSGSVMENTKDGEN